MYPNGDQAFGGSGLEDGLSVRRIRERLGDRRVCVVGYRRGVEMLDFYRGCFDTCSVASAACHGVNIDQHRLEEVFLYAAGVSPC